MNWKLFADLGNLAGVIYWILFMFSLMLAIFSSDHKRYSDSLNVFHWRMVAIWRFVRPIRFIMLAPVGYSLFKDNMHWYNILLFILYVAFCFIKDRFGDDDRDKKKSRVLERIKSIGHRLVVVPQ